LSQPATQQKPGRSILSRFSICAFPGRLNPAGYPEIAQMKVATFNVNSLRRRLPAVLAWLAQHQPDVFCLQETKVQDSDFPLAEIEAAGYHAAFRGMKSYNGVATLTREKPDAVIYGLHDTPGTTAPAAEQPTTDDVRILQTVVRGIPIVNTYVPQGQSIVSDKYVAKLLWFKHLKRYFETRLDPARPALWLGDINVAPEPIDVYHPDRRANDVDFHIDARNAFKETCSWGFTDLFRLKYPERVQYTYWDYFRRAFENNWGWRIDHILATAPLVARCTAIDVDIEPRKAPGASDHTVVWAEFADA
jgi:exodeoxyribonuclease III